MGRSKCGVFPKNMTGKWDFMAQWGFKSWDDPMYCKCSVPPNLPVDSESEDNLWIWQMKQTWYVFRLFVGGIEPRSPPKDANGTLRTQVHVWPTRPPWANAQNPAIYHHLPPTISHHSSRDFWWPVFSIHRQIPMPRCWRLAPKHVPLRTLWVLRHQRHQLPQSSHPEGRRPSSPGLPGKASVELSHRVHLKDSASKWLSGLIIGGDQPNHQPIQE